MQHKLPLVCRSVILVFSGIVRGKLSCSNVHLFTCVLGAAENNIWTLKQHIDVLKSLGIVKPELQILKECHREVQESATQVVWPRKEARPRLRRKKDSGDGTTWEKKARKTEEEMDGLCQPRHESHRNDER